MEKIKQSIEVEGSTVEDAIQKALNILNVPRDAISVKIVCEEKRGLFGMEGAKLAKIKVDLIKNKLDQTKGKKIIRNKLNE